MTITGVFHSADPVATCGCKPLWLTTSLLRVTIRGSFACMSLITPAYLFAQVPTLVLVLVQWFSKMADTITLKHLGFVHAYASQGYSLAETVYKTARGFVPSFVEPYAKTAEETAVSVAAPYLTKLQDSAVAVLSGVDSQVIKRVAHFFEARHRIVGLLITPVSSFVQAMA